MVNAGNNKSSKGFLDLDMRLVSDILHLFVKEVNRGYVFDMKDLVYIMGKKGYGDNKVRMTVRVMAEERVLLKRREIQYFSPFFGNQRTKRSWSYVYMPTRVGEHILDINVRFLGFKGALPTFVQVKGGMLK